MLTAATALALVSAVRVFPFVNAQEAKEFFHDIFY